MLLDDLTPFSTSQAFPPKAAVTDNTAQVSSTLDTAGCSSVTLELNLGTLSDANSATFTLTFYEGNASNMSDETAVADADLITCVPGTAPEAAASFTQADDNVTKSIGYRGAKRYVRAKVVPTSNSGNLFLAGIWRKRPLNAPGSAA